MKNGISVHLGVNTVDSGHYVGNVPTLVGCHNDAHAMEAIAKARGFVVQAVLLDAQATSARLLAEIAAAAAKLQNGDTFFLSFAGHGANVPSNGFDPEEEFDQVWALYDRMFLDGELAGRWPDFNDGVRIVVIADECHSGSVLRASTFASVRFLAASSEAPRARELRGDVAQFTFERHRDEYLALQKKAAEDRNRPLKADAVSFGACRDQETTRDAPDDRSNGVFTAAILNKWQGGAFRSTYRVLFEGAYSHLQTQLPGQHPQWKTRGPTTPSPFLWLNAFSLE